MSGWEKRIIIGSGTSFGKLIRFRDLLVVVAYESGTQGCHLYATDLEGNRVWQIPFETFSIRALAAGPHGIFAVGRLWTLQHGQTVPEPGVVFITPDGHSDHVQTLPAPQELGLTVELAEFSAVGVDANGTAWMAGSASVKSTNRPKWMGFLPCIAKRSITSTPGGTNEIRLDGSREPQSYWINSLCIAPDGGVVLAGLRQRYSDDELFIRRYFGFNCLWEKTTKPLGGLDHPLGLARSLEGRAVVCTPDDGYVAVGQATRNRGGRVDSNAYAMKLKLDASGKEVVPVWDYELRGSDFTAVVYADDNTLLVLGTALSQIDGSSDFDMLVLKVDNSSSHESPRVLWECRPCVGKPGGIVAAPDGGAFCSGTINSGGRELGYLAKIDGTGRVA